jgi:hypothetical protein
MWSGPGKDVSPAGVLRAEGSRRMAMIDRVQAAVKAAPTTPSDTSRVVIALNMRTSRQHHG